MNIFAKRIKNCRENIKKNKAEYTQGYVAEKIGVARTTYTAYENGTKTPPIDTVNLIANFFGVTSDYLLGRTDNPNPLSKDERDIAKRLKQFEADLENSDGLAFDGEPMSDEAKESLLESMELLFRQTQRINKKYTPKKYREEQ